MNSITFFLLLREVCYELVNMLIKEEADPNMVGRDGSSPLMVCLVPLINKDPLHSFTHSMKVGLNKHINLYEKNRIYFRIFRYSISIASVYYYNMVRIQIVHTDLI